MFFSSTVYTKTGNPAALVFIPICVGRRTDMGILMNRKFCLLMVIAMLIFLCAEGVADGLTINVAPSYGILDAIVTVDCSITCDDMDSANYYIDYDPAELSFQGLYRNEIPEIEYESRFRILSNAVNDPDLVDQRGMVGVVIYNESGLADQSYFNTPKRLFSLQFKILRDSGDAVSIDYSGSGGLRTAVMVHGMMGSWRGEYGSGTIALLDPLEDGDRLMLPEQIKSVEEAAFANGCFNFISAPAGLQSLGARAFADCTALRDAFLPDTLTSISEDAFDNCPELIIHCPRNSQAEAFARAHGIPYILTKDEM